jgi:glycosyltransferase involved in cell wall biosynthesis
LESSYSSRTGQATRSPEVRATGERVHFLRHDGGLQLRVFAVAPPAQLTDHRSHGDGLVAYGFVRELAERGHEIHVAAHRVDLRDPPSPGVRLHLLGEPPPRPGVRTRIASLWRVRRLFERLGGPAGFDLVHQLNPVDAGLSLAIAGHAVPVVLGPYVPSWPRSGPGSIEAPGSRLGALKRAVQAAQQRRARVVLLSTPAAAPRLTRGARSALVREVPPGIDERFWSPSPDEAPDARTVLFLANLRIRKGILVLLDAFERVAAERPDAALRIAGSGPLEEQVRRRVAGSPARDRIELLGHVEREHAPALIRGAGVFCAPSYAEPFGMSALEAMACGRPVVATDAGGVRHLVEPAGGRLVPPGDAGALAAALQEVLADPALRRRMGEHNRRVVEERFTWARVGDRLEAAYAEALSGTRRADSARARYAPIKA